VGVDPAAVGKALAARIADLEAAMARADSFAYRPDAGPERPEALEGGELQATARDMALGALRAAADPVGYTMLLRLAAGDATLDTLARESGLSRLATWERLNGLVQVGLAGRSYENDTAGLTPAGTAIVELVEGAAVAVKAERGRT
jgi:hypothetical protein